MYRHAMLTATKRGRAEGQRDAVCLLCRMLGIEFGAQQEEHLTALLSHLEQHRELPDGF